MLSDFLKAINDGHTWNAINSCQGIEANAGHIVLAGHFAEMDYCLSRGVNSKHRLGTGLLVTLLVVMGHDELIVMLPPCKHITPMTQVVRNDW